MKLTNIEIGELAKALFVDFPLQSSMEELLQAEPINEAFARFIMPGGITMPAHILVIAKTANAEDWIAALVRGARNLRSTNEVYIRLDEKLSTRPANPVDPLEFCCLSGDDVLVNREELRTALRGLRDHDGKRILVIRDTAPPIPPPPLGTKTGKSHSIQFIAKFKESVGDFEFIWIDLDELKRDLVGGVITPFDLAARLARELEYQHVPDGPKDMQWPRWNTDFCVQLVTNAKQDARIVWIVIDEFNKVDLPEAVFDLIKKLASRVRLHLSRFRLVLVGYNDNFEPSIVPHVAVECTERNVSAKDLVKFFDRAKKQRGLQLTDDEIEEAVAEILAGRDCDTVAYLQEIGRETAKAIRRFEQPRIGAGA